MSVTRDSLAPSGGPFVQRYSAELEAENMTLKLFNEKLLEAQVSTRVAGRSRATVSRAAIEDPTAPFVIPGDRRARAGGLVVHFPP